MSTTEREVIRELPAVLDPRVERGAALLDEKMPGWAEKIDLRTLRMAGCPTCVLGQLYGSFIAGADLLFGRKTGENDHGFAAWGNDAYDALEQDWRLAILSRRQLR